MRCVCVGADNLFREEGIAEEEGEVGCGEEIGGEVDRCEGIGGGRRRALNEPRLATAGREGSVRKGEEWEEVLIGM